MNEKVLLAIVVILAVTLAGTLVYFLGNATGTAIGIAQPTTTPATASSFATNIMNPQSRSSFSEQINLFCQQHPNDCKSQTATGDEEKVFAALDTIAQAEGFPDLQNMTDTQFYGFWRRLLLYICCRGGGIWAPCCQWR